MNALAETSFLCSLYRQDGHIQKVDKWRRDNGVIIHISSLVAFEYRQSIRLLVFQNSCNPKIGVDSAQGDLLIERLREDIRSGIIQVIDGQWSEVHSLAEILSHKHTPLMGNRFAGILHVATALHLGSRDFLSFDTNQCDLAKAEGLAVPL